MMRVCRRPPAPGHRPPPLPSSAQRPTSAERRRCQGGTPSTDQDKLDLAAGADARSCSSSRYEDKVALPTVFVRFESGTMARRRRNPPRSRQSVKVWLISHTPTRGRALFRPETAQTPTIAMSSSQARRRCHTATRFALPPALPGSGAVAGQQRLWVGARRRPRVDYPSCVGRSRRRTLVGSLPSARIRPTACEMGSDTTAIWKALA